MNVKKSILQSLQAIDNRQIPPISKVNRPLEMNPSQIKMPSIEKKMVKKLLECPTEIRIGV